MKAIVSKHDLAHKLHIDVKALQSLAKDTASHYRSWARTDKTTGKTREFKVPDDQLKRVQRQILRGILDNCAISECTHGGVKGKSPETNARLHCGASLVVTMDIRRFFPSVCHRLVAKVFRTEFLCGRDVTWLLTRLTTIDGQLPQGAPTSTALANIVLAQAVDKIIQDLARSEGVEVTRFVDDYAFSGPKSRLLVNATAKQLSRLGLSIGRGNDKLRFMPASQRQEVTGLTVNSPSGLSVSRPKRDCVRAAIHQLPQLLPTERSVEIESIRGKIKYVAKFNPGTGKRLEKQLNEVLEAVL